MKKLALVSTVSDLRSGSSAFYIKRIISLLSKIYSVELFVPQRSSFHQLSLEYTCPVSHLHCLPTRLSGKEFCNVIYSLENRDSSYLCAWYLRLYPGIVILHDKSFFSLVAGALAHGTDSYELNALVRSEYPDSSMRLGDDHIRNRNLEVYADLYPFLNSVVSNSIAVGMFGESLIHRELLHKKKFFLNRSSILDCSESVLRSQENSLNKSDKKSKYAVIVESPYSVSALEILKYATLDKTIGCFPKLFILEESAGSFLLHNEVEYIDSLLERKEYAGLLVLGNRDIHGMRAAVGEALESGIPVTCQSSGEYLGYNLPGILYHASKDSLEQVIKGISDTTNEKGIVVPKSEITDDGRVLIEIIEATEADFLTKIKGVFCEQDSIITSNINQAYQVWNNFSDFLPKMEQTVFQLGKEYVSDAKKIFLANDSSNV